MFGKSNQLALPSAADVPSPRYLDVSDSDSSSSSEDQTVHTYGTMDNIEVIKQAQGLPKPVAETTATATYNDGEFANDGEAKVRGISNWQAAYHLVSFTAGGGIVVFPLALVQLQWYGILLLLSTALITMYTSRLLSKCLATVRWSRRDAQPVTYGDVAFECFGRYGRRFTNGVLYFNFVVAASGYMSLASICITSISTLTYNSALAAVALATWLHTLIPSFRALSFFSALNVSLILWLEAIIIGDALFPPNNMNASSPSFHLVSPDLTFAPTFMRITYTFSILLGGFFSHAVMPTIFNAMKTPRECTHVTGRMQVAMLIVIYLPLCAVTYAVYGSDLQTPLFFNLSNALIIKVSIAIYALHMLLTYTVTMYPLQQAIEKSITKRQNKGRGPHSLLWVHSLSESPHDGSNYLGRIRDTLHTSYESLERVITNRNTIQSRREMRIQKMRLRWTVRVSVRTALLLLTWITAYVARLEILRVFGLLLVPMALLALILPPVLYWKLFMDEIKWTDKIMLVSTIILAIVTTVCSLQVQQYHAE